MAETSRTLVTITLGRSGQVVKKAGCMSDDGVSDSMPTVGTKRSVRDRLGSNAGDFLAHESQLDCKRLRGDNNRASLSTNGTSDLHVGKDDLRFKLMQKNVFRRLQNDDQQNSVDLREMLPRTVQPPLKYQLMPERKDSGILGPIPATRIAHYWPQIDPLRNFCAPWTLEQIRRRSPEGVSSTSKGLSPKRKTEELQKRALAFEDVSLVPYTHVDTLKSVGAAPIMAKSTIRTGAVKPVGPVLTQLYPPGSIPPKSSYTSDKQPTVDNLLNSLGLGKYAIHFKAEEVDMNALKQMGDRDLKELGIPMGPRKKILLALLPHSKQLTQTRQ